MQYSSVIVLQRDGGAAKAIVASLCNTFSQVRSVRTLDELRANIISHRAESVVLDMEVASIKALERLSREFPQTTIVCTHRVADEALWVSALRAGAADVCAPTDTTAVVSALRHTPMRHDTAA
jgi:DNA-binding NtrC family response regulator